MKRMHWLALSLLLIVLCTQAVAHATADVVYVYNPNPQDRLNLRESQSSGALVLGKLYTGAAAEVLERFSNFTHVRIGETVGYLANEFLTDTRMEWDPGDFRIVNMENDGEVLNFRKGPSRDSVFFGAFGNGTTVQYLDSEGDYAKVRTALENDGYMLESALTERDDERRPLLTKLTVGKLDDDAQLMSFPGSYIEGSEGKGLVMGTVPQGSIVRILSVVGTWYYVEVDGMPGLGGASQRGFLPCHVMRVGNYEEGGAIKTEVLAVVKTGRDGVRLPIRSSPLVTGQLLLTLINTSQVRLPDGVPSPGDPWWHVRVGNVDGYILSEFMEIIETGDPSQWQ